MGNSAQPPAHARSDDQKQPRGAGYHRARPGRKHSYQRLPHRHRHQDPRRGVRSAGRLSHRGRAGCCVVRRGFSHPHRPRGVHPRRITRRVALRVALWVLQQLSSLIISDYLRYTESTYGTFATRDYLALVVALAKHHHPGGCAAQRGAQSTVASPRAGRRGRHRRRLPRLSGLCPRAQLPRPRAGLRRLSPACHRGEVPRCRAEIGCCGCWSRRSNSTVPPTSTLSTNDLPSWPLPRCTRRACSPLRLVDTSDRAVIGNLERPDSEGSFARSPSRAPGLEAQPPGTRRRRGAGDDFAARARSTSWLTQRKDTDKE